MFGGMDKMLGPMIEQFKRDLDKAKAELKEMTIEASAGGGMVTAKTDGEGGIKEVKIAPEALEGADAEMLGDMIVAAVREATEEAKRVKGEKLSGLFGGMDMLGLDVSSIL